MINKFYYFDSFVKHSENSPWDALKYSGDLAKSEASEDKKLTEKLTEKLKNASKATFEEKLYLNVDNTRVKYFRFLNSLTYLAKDNFEGFRNFMNSKISSFSDAWILFSLETSKNSALPKGAWTSPYISSDAFGADKELDLSQTVSVNNFLKEKYQGGFYGLYISDNSFGVDVEDKYKDKFDSKNLYKFGNDASGMKEFVKSISSSEDYQKLVEYIKTLPKEPKEPKDWVSWLSYDHIYIKDNNNNNIKYLDLSEKKNLMLSLLNDQNVSINENSIDKNSLKVLLFSCQAMYFTFPSSEI